MKLSRAEALEALKAAAVDHVRKLFQVRVEAPTTNPQEAALANERFGNGVDKMLATYRDTFEIVKRKTEE